MSFALRISQMIPWHMSHSVDSISTHHAKSGESFTVFANTFLFLTVEDIQSINAIIRNMGYMPPQGLPMFMTSIPSSYNTNINSVAL